MLTFAKSSYFSILDHAVVNPNSIFRYAGRKLVLTLHTCFIKRPQSHELDVQHQLKAVNVFKRRVNIVALAN